MLPSLPVVLTFLMLHLIDWYVFKKIIYIWHYHLLHVQHYIWKHNYAAAPCINGTCTWVAALHLGTYSPHLVPIEILEISPPWFEFILKWSTYVVWYNFIIVSDGGGLLKLAIKKCLLGYVQCTYTHKVRTLSCVFSNKLYTLRDVYTLHSIL